MKKHTLHNIKSSGFKTPDDYFDSVEDMLFLKLDDVDLSIDNDSNGFKTPEGYFETLDKKIFDEVTKKDNVNIISIFSWEKVAYISGIAASILLVFNLSIFNKSVSFDSLDNATVESYILEEVELDEMANLFTDLELKESNFIDVNLNDETLDFYLETLNDTELISN